MFQRSSFIKQYLPQFYIKSVEESLNAQFFLDLKSETNIYSLTSKLVELIYPSSLNESENWTHTFFQEQFLVKYDQLRSLNPQIQEGDSGVIEMFKKGLSYMERLLIQLLMRLLAVYFETERDMPNQDHIRNYLEEFYLIFLLAKTEVTWNRPDISFYNYLQNFFTLLGNKNLSEQFLTFMLQVKEKCEISGQLDRFIEDFVYRRRMEKRKAEKEEKENITQDSNSNRIYKNQSLQGQKGQKKQKGIDQKYQNLDDRDMLRKKKKIIKERFKPTLFIGKNGMNPTQSTIKENIPETIRKQSDMSSPSRSSMEFPRYTIKKKVPERTLFHCKKGKFVSKKEGSCDLFFQNVTLSTLDDDYQSSMKTERKVCRTLQYETPEPHGYYVPQTPNPAIKQRKIEKRAISFDFPEKELKIALK